VEDMLSHPPIFASIVLLNMSLYFQIYSKHYVDDGYFKVICAKMAHASQVDNYDLEGNLLYHLGTICIPTNERIHVIREAYTSLVLGH